MSRIPLAEKYRPKRIDEILGQEHVKKPIKALIQSNNIPHMLFIGPAGCGKTTMAHAIAHELGWPIIELNASDERGIEVVRTKIKRLALSRGHRIILLDEADSMTEDAQHALRRLMEKAVDARFILTANFESKIIDPIKSRCAIFRFEPLPKELIIKRMVEILKYEGIRITKDKLPTVKEALSIIVDVANGDMRKALNLLETVIGNKMELTPENVRVLVAPNMASEALELAFKGDLQGAVRKLEDLIINNKLDVDATIRHFYNAIKSLNDSIQVKAKLFIELARAEHAIKMGGTPLIQLTGVLALAWYYAMTKGGKT